MSMMTEAPPAGRIRAAWVAAHAPAAGVPRWALVAAYAVPLTVLPSSVWRIAVCTFHAPIMRGDLGSALGSSGRPGVPLGLYVILLSIVSELLAFTAVGLVSAWGEVVPRWIPLIGGRRVAPLAAVVPAALGATALLLLTIPNARGFGVAPDAPKGLALVVMNACYAPLLLWGPLLAVVTVSYYRRRTR